MAEAPVTARGWRAVAVGAAAGILLALGVPAALNRLSEEECKDDGKLKIATGDDVSVGGERRRIIESWGKTQMIEISKVADLKHAEMLAAAQAAPCQAYDLLIIDSAVTPEFAAAGLLHEIDPGDVPGGLVPEASASGAWEGRQYALPFALDVGLLYRRKEQSRPADWQDLWERTRATAIDPAKDVYLAQLDDFEGGTVGLLELLRAYGAEVVDDDGEIVLDRPENLGNARTALWRLWWENQRGTMSGSWSAKEEESLMAFAEGKAPYLRHWPYAALQLISRGDPDFHVSELPGPATLGGSNLAVTAGSTKYDAAVKLMRHLLTPQNQGVLFACGGYAPVLTAAYTKVSTCPHGGEDGTPPTRPQLQELADAVRDTLKGHRAARPKLAHYSRFSDVFRRCVTKYVLADDPPAEDGIRTIARELRVAALGKIEADPPCG
ncbi:extracellular solute-binding protein [Nonomuraea rhizosphaerae]|uniref:extracellular solute-binding protein n=1 Tax=Nonomuraea rhizosphaerae TaxID=2665663 RepID=UPI001C5E5738|nr:extracellular solute-binding protein [Nonomuraea rhizosphaerae]